ncbi:MAG: M20 family metallo-hydrolase [Nesterenkonia sp.]|nr:M20 family metallo-hydrolase [Nesterenkonia sp.]
MIAPSADRVREDLAALARLTDSAQPGWTRTALSEPDVAGREWVLARMREVGLDARIDPAGNVIGVRRGARGGRMLMTGSHTDTVPSGGRFDGMVGVVGALEVVRAFDEAGIRLDHDLVVVDFFGEEPNRFGLSCVGSRALTGVFDTAMLDVLDEEGRSFGDALAAVGIDPATMTASTWPWDRVDAFIELHIEQGPMLEHAGTSIGLVSSITGISRFRALFGGRRDHAGTTGMDRRADAGCAAAGTVLAVERIARSGPDGAKGTTGGVTFTPAAVNVVTEAAEMRGEFRSIDDEWLRTAEETLASCAAEESAGRGVTVEMEWLPQAPRRLDGSVTEMCRRAVDDLGLSRAELFSGAEHDAAFIAARSPTAMLFVPSVGGRSHCPEEWTELDDVVDGIRALAESLRRADAVRR